MERSFRREAEAERNELCSDDGPLVKWLRQRPLTPLTSVRIRYGSPSAPLAQLVEQLTLNQWVPGSSP